MIQIVGVIQILGAVLTILNVRGGSSLLILFILAANTVIHNPLMFKDKAEADENMAHFMKNLAILGGLLLFRFQSSPKTVTEAPKSVRKSVRPRKD